MEIDHAQLPENPLERTKVHHKETLELQVEPLLTVKVVVKGDQLPVIDCHKAVITTEVTLAHHAGVTVHVELMEPLVADPDTTHDPDIAAPLTLAEPQLLGSLLPRSGTVLVIQPVLV